MKRSIAFLLSAMLLLWGVDARADSYSDTVTLFKNAGESAAFFQNCYGYAVFPTVGKAVSSWVRPTAGAAYTCTNSTWAIRP